MIPTWIEPWGKKAANWIRTEALDSLEVDSDEVRSRVARWKDEGATTDDDLRRRAKRHHARAAALHGFTTGLVPGVLGSMAVSVLDARGISKERILLSATYAYIADQSFFDRDDYKLAIAESLRSGDLVTDYQQDEGWERSAVQFHAIAYVGRAVRRGALRWVGKRFLGGAPALFVPIVGGTIGAAWNVGEIYWVASRYDNDPVPSAEPSIA